MSLKQICDLAYQIQLDKIERMTETDRIIKALEICLLGGDGSLPTVDERRAQFDKALTDSPEAEDPERAILMRALGLGIYGRADAS